MKYKNLIIAATFAGASVLNAATGDLKLLGGWDFNGGNTANYTAALNGRYSDLLGDSQGSVLNFSPGPGNSAIGQFYTNGVGGSDNWGSIIRNAASSADATIDSNTSGRKLGSLTGVEYSIVFNTATADEFSFLVHASNAGLNYENLYIKFDSLVVSGGPTTSIDWSYRTTVNGTNVSTGVTTSGITGNTYASYTADFSSLAAVDGLADLYLIGKWSAASTVTRLDNFAVYGYEAAAAIPEPSTYATLAGACGLVLAAYRRRRSSK